MTEKTICPLSIASASGTMECIREDCAAYIPKELARDMKRIGAFCSIIDGFLSVSLGMDALCDEVIATRDVIETHLIGDFNDNS